MTNQTFRSNLVPPLDINPPTARLGSQEETEAVERLEKIARSETVERLKKVERPEAAEKVREDRKIGNN